MIEKHVCTLESARRLKELGVPQNSLFYWWVYPHNIKIKMAQNKLGNDYSAFTAGELGELLPNWAASFKATYPGGIIWQCEDGQSPEHKFKAYTEAEARAKCLIYLLENKLMEITK